MLLFTCENSPGHPVGPPIHIGTVSLTLRLECIRVRRRVDFIHSSPALVDGVFDVVLIRPANPPLFVLHHLSRWTNTRCPVAVAVRTSD